MNEHEAESFAEGLIASGSVHAVAAILAAAAKLADNDFTFTSGTAYVDAEALRAIIARECQ